MYKKDPNYSFDYSRLNWKNEDFSGKVLSSTDFSHAFASHINFSGATLRKINFSGANLMGADFSRAALHNVDFSGAFLYDATFAEAELRDVNFSEARFRRTTLTQATLLRNVHVDSPKRFTRLTLSPDGKLLAAVEEQQQQIWIWNIALSQPGQVLALLTAQVRDLFFHPIMHLLVSVQADKSIDFWEADALQLLHHLELASQPWWDTAREVTFSPSGRFFVLRMMTDQGFSLFLWDQEHKKITQEILVNSQGPFAFSPDSMLLATAGKTVSLWDLSSGQLLRQFPLPEARELTFHASGHTLFVLADRLYQVEVNTGNLLDPQLAQYPGHTRSVTKAVFSPDSTLLATCDGATVQVWQVPDGKHLFASPGHQVLFSPDGAWMAILIGQSDAFYGKDEVQWREVPTWQLSKSFTTTRHDAFLLSPNGILLLCFYGQTWTTHPAPTSVEPEADRYEGDLALFDVEKGMILWPDMAQQIKPGSYGVAVWQATFSPDSRWLTLITEDERRILRWHWDLTTGFAEPPVAVDYREPDYPFEHRRKGPDPLPASSVDGRWQVRAEGHRVQIWDQEQQLLVARTSEPPNPETIYPTWHDRRVCLGLASSQETWSDLSVNTPPEHAELEQMLIVCKIAYEDSVEHPQSILPHGSRQDEFWHSIKELAFEPIQQVLAAVHQDGTLSIFQAATGHYQHIYYDPLSWETI